MSWMFGEHWPWVLLAAVLGAAITLFLMLRKISWETLTARRTVTEVGADVATPAVAADLDADADVDLPSADLDGARVGLADADLNLDADLPSVDADLPSVDADLPSVDGELPSVDAELPSVDADLPSVDAELPSVDADLPSVDADLPSVDVPEVSGAEIAGGVGLAGVAAAVSGDSDKIELGKYAGSAAARADRSMPAGYPIKGNEDSMLYHTEESPYYGRTIAEVWFDTEANAEAGGFTRWDRRERKAKVAPLAEVVEPGKYAGSAAARADRSMPAGYPIKGNEDSMLYHTEESPYYGRTIAEVWFDTEANAEAGGFTRWDRRERKAKVAGFADLPAESSFGPGSAEPNADGSAPHASFTIKGNADSMLYHPSDSPYFARTKAEVWFNSEEAAEAAGFTHWDRN